MTVSDLLEWWEYRHRQGHYSVTIEGSDRFEEDMCPFCHPELMEDRDAGWLPAIFSTDRRYRYVLRRRVGLESSTCLFICLNPSTADEVQNDPTVRRCMSFARSWGFGTLVVCNAFAYRATSPRYMMRQEDPVGAENDVQILREAREADLVVLAWGNHGAHLRRSHTLLHYLYENDIEVEGLWCFGLTQQDEPRHPLYVPSDQELIPFFRGNQ